MKKTLFIVILSAATIFPRIAEAIYVTIDASPRDYRNKTVLLDGSKAVGKTGDYFELGEGTHSLHIDAPRNHFVILKINIKGSELTATVRKEQHLDKNGCKEDWITAWRGRLSSSLVDIRHGVLWKIKLPKIRFIRASGDGTCVFPSSMSCERSSYFLTVDSQPRNAEIWVGASKIRYRTPTGRLKGSFCLSQNRLHILTRAPGYINCVKQFELFRNANISYMCKMVRR